VIVCRVPAIGLIQEFTIEILFADHGSLRF